jgi:hypothetical protein
MVEQISKMKVEELPAVVTGVNNEIGTNEGQQFEQSVTEALTTLEAALTSSKGALTSALGIVTGDGGGEEMAPDAFGGEEGMDDMGGEEEMGGGMDDLGADDGEELPELPEPDMEEPEEELGGAGRERR